MNSTQRLLACMRGELPDRVPISTYELVGWNAAAWENQAPGYRGMMDLIRAETDCLYMCGIDVPNAAAAREVMRHEGADRGKRRQVLEGQGFSVTIERWDDRPHHFVRSTTHIAGRDLVTVRSHTDDIKTTWTREHPVKTLDDLNAYLQIPWTPGQADFSGLRRAWRDLDETDGDKAAPPESDNRSAEEYLAAATRGLPLVSVGDPICELAEAFEFGDFTVFALTETDALVRAFDILHERYRERLRRMLRGPVANTVFRICGPEYATAPYLPPALFERLVTRYDREYIQMIQAAGAWARLHSHGRLAGVVDQIAAMAPDALDPCEPPPDGDIDLAQLKAALGERVCLCGGIELKHLEHADAPAVAELTRATMRQGKPGGRFVIMPTAAPINIPLAAQTADNYRTFIETARAEADY